MSGSCKAHPHDPNGHFSPNLDDWRTFGIKQDSGRAINPDLHPSHAFWHLVINGFVPGKAPGPAPTNPLADGWSVEKILCHDQAAGYMSDPWLQWVVRPNGDACQETYFKWCENCQGIVAVPHGCHSKTCPRCWISWANVRAHEITAKIAYARRAGYTRGRPWHVIIRPPKGTIGFTWAELAAFRTLCYKIARAHGIKGGVAVIHWGPDKDPREPWAPHVHIIGYLTGRYKPGPTEQGWLIKFIKIGGKDGVYKHVQRVAFYELTHAVRPPAQGHAMTWFGFMANNQMPRPSAEMVASMGLEPSDGPHCPDCSGKLVSLDCWDYTDPSSPVYIGNRLDSLDRPPPIITGPGERKTFDTWDGLLTYMDEQKITV